MLNRQRSQISSSQSMATGQLRVKLRILFSRHDKMKKAYQLLKSQIKTSLLEAEEVFASLAIPLMKLVGLKTVEMAEEGRRNAIIIDADSPCCRRSVGSGSPALTVVREEQNKKLEVLNYAAKGTTAGKQLIEKQQTRLAQLVRLLRQIEIQVNSRHDDILQTLANHHISFHQIFQKAINCLTNLHTQNLDTYPVALKLLRAIFDHMDLVFGSVESGVDNLMQDLAELMCNPMVEYVKGLKGDMTIGPCARLLAVVEEMGIAIRNGELELEEAKKRIRVAEEGKIEALRKLNETEEIVRRMNQHVRFLPEGPKGSRDACIQRKYKGILGKISTKASGTVPQGMREDQDKDDKLLWELLKKRRYIAPESPMGPGGLLCFEPNKKRHKLTTQLMSHMPASQSCAPGLQGPQTPSKVTRISLGSSPSATIQQGVSRKRINP